jgi:hypothetical protein
MANGMSVDKLIEVINTTLETVEPPSYEDLSRTRQKYIAAKQILKKRRKQLRGLGGTYRWDVKVTNHGQAEHVGAYEVEQVTVKDMFMKANVPVRVTRGKYAFDIIEEELNGGPEQVVDVIKAREVDAYGDVVDKIEQSFWAPGIDVTDDKTPWPIHHTIRPHPSASTPPGFNGGNPPGWPDKQGINCSAVTRFNNWTAGWKDMSDVSPGFIYRLNEAMDRTRFQAPYPYPNRSPEEDDYMFLTGYALRQQINQWLRRQNDNIGRDLRNFFGDPLLNGTPVQWLEDYDDVGVWGNTMPFIGLNFSVIEVLQVPGWDFKRIGPEKAPMQKTVVECFIYKMWNTINRDPSRSFMLNYFADLSA